MDVTIQGVIVGGMLALLGSIVANVISRVIEKMKQKDNEKSRLDGLIMVYIDNAIYSWRCCYLREYYLNKFNNSQADKYYDMLQKYDERNEIYRNKTIDALQRIIDCISILGYLFKKDVSKIINNIDDIGFMDDSDSMLKRVMSQTLEENEREYLSTLTRIRDYDIKYKEEFNKVRKNLRKLNIDIRIDNI